MISEEGKISNDVVLRDNGDIFVDGVLASDIQAPMTGKEVKADAFQDRYQIACPYEIAGLIKKYDPYSSAASFATTEYFHKKGYFVNNMIAVKKCYATIYTEAHYEGFSFSRNFYFVHEFNM